MDSVKEYKPGLDITASAYDATNNSNVMTSSEYFEFNEVGIYDTQENRWLDLSEEDLKNPEILNKYSDDSRYAIALGADMNNIDGFMNMESYLSEKGIKDDGLDVLRKQNAAALEREKNSGIVNDKEQLKRDLGYDQTFPNKDNSNENGASELRQVLEDFNNGNNSSSTSNATSSNSNTGVNTQPIGENVISRAFGTITETINNLGSSNNTNAQPASNENASNGSGGAAELNQALQGSNPIFPEPKNYGPSYMGGEPYQK